MYAGAGREGMRLSTEPPTPATIRAMRSPHVLSFLLFALSTACARETAPRHRAILVSFDSFNRSRFEATLDPASIPAFTRLFREGVCASHAMTQWATDTPVAHATLWTGAWAHITGVGRQEAALPEDEWSWLDPRFTASRYAAPHLAAEPIWITAGRQGLSVFAHHPTHAPAAPNYRRMGEAMPDSVLEVWRNEAAATLALPDVRVMNGYNRRYMQRVLTGTSHPPRRAPRWQGATDAEWVEPAFEIAWDAGPDSLFALLRGSPGFTEMVVAPARDLARGVTVRPVPANGGPMAGDTSAPHFAEPILLREDDTPIGVGVRLFELSGDGRRYTLYQTGAEVIESNHAQLTADYVAATGGWVGNAYGPELGEWLGRGGDGSAEARQLDAYAYLMRQWMRGSRFAWSFGPDLFIDYNPSADAFDHDWYGWIATDRPGYDPQLARQVLEVRAQGFALLDRHLDLLMNFTEEDPGTMLFVTSDHGMRPVWQAVHPNTILAEAGLLTADDSGGIDLARTRALSPDGWGIVINRISRKGGIVPPRDEADVVAAARAAMEAARGPDGDPLVERIYTQADFDSLFGSGPSSNSLYIGWKRGLQGNARMNETALRPLAWPRGDHGATLPYLEGMAGFCVYGAAVGPGTIPAINQTDVAPTIADWLGIAPPRQSTGRSVLGAILNTRR